MSDPTTLREEDIRPGNLIAEQDAAYERDLARLLARRAEFIAAPCPACGSVEARPLFEKFTLHFVDCVRCRTIYMKPRPSEAAMGDYYANSENYQFWAKHIFPASEASRREKINRPWLERIVALCDEQSIARNHLLEVGAGFGTFSALAQDERTFARVTAIEPTPEMAAACRERGVTVIEKPIEAIGAEVEPADVATAFEVIEHLFDPIQFFAQLRRLLRPGGLLVVSCPNGRGFDIATLGADSVAVDSEHVNLFNPESLAFLAERCGFETLTTSTPGRLDAELVRNAAQKGTIDLSGQPFLNRVLIEEWDTLGAAFQQFLAANRLSSHLWAVFRRPVAD